MTFVYTVNREGPRVSVITSGELDVTAAGPFGTMLCQLAGSEPPDSESSESESSRSESTQSEPSHSEPPERIEVDLGGLMFIDSTGIAALNRAYRTTSRNGCELVITNATGVVLRALELTGTLTHLTECPEDRTEVDTSRPPA